MSLHRPGYRPSKAMRRFIALRDRTCVFPGCNRQARACDVDHVEPYDAGGATCDCNGESLCGFHHRLKHETPFDVRWSTNPAHPPGTLIWTTPTGTEHTRYPVPLDPPTGRFAQRIATAERAAERAAAQEAQAEAERRRRDVEIPF